MIRNMRMAGVVACCIVSMGLPAGNHAMGATIGIEVTAMNAGGTAINLPTIPGNPSSGPVTLSVTPGVNPVGTLDQSTGEGILKWPVRMDFPLLQMAGFTLLIVLAGTVPEASEQMTQGFDWLCRTFVTCTRPAELTLGRPRSSWLG